MGGGGEGRGCRTAILKLKYSPSLTSIKKKSFPHCSGTTFVCDGLGMGVGESKGERPFLKTCLGCFLKVVPKCLNKICSDWLTNVAAKVLVEGVCPIHRSHPHNPHSPTHLETVLVVSFAVSLHL